MNAVSTAAIVGGNVLNTAAVVVFAMLLACCANSALAVNNYNMQQHNQHSTNLITFKTY